MGSAKRVSLKSFSVRATVLPEANVQFHWRQKRATGFWEL